MNEQARTEPRDRPANVYRGVMMPRGMTSECMDDLCRYLNSINTEWCAEENIEECAVSVFLKVQSFLV
jgi:hypothetical protein